MLDRLLTGLFGPAPAPLDPLSGRLALAALLVRIARSDGRYEVRETRLIGEVLAARYGLDPAAAARLRSEAEAVEAAAPDTVRFTRAIKAAVPYEDRFEVVAALWRVVLADGERAPEENALLRLAANLLGVSDRDSGIARLSVSGG